MLPVQEMQKLAAELSAKFQAQGWPKIRIRIGIGLNTGTTEVGNMGASLHLR
jgi:class 3 adenylate cyclase